MKKASLIIYITTASALCLIVASTDNSVPMSINESKASSLKTFTMTSWKQIESHIKYQYEGYSFVNVNYYNDNGDGSYLNLYSFSTSYVNATFGEDYLFELRQNKNYIAQFSIFIYLNNIVSVSWEFDSIGEYCDVLTYTGNSQSSGERHRIEKTELVGTFYATMQMDKMVFSGRVGTTTGNITKLRSLSITYDTSLCDNN